MTISKQLTVLTAAALVTLGACTDDAPVTPEGRASFDVVLRPEMGSSAASLLAAPGGVSDARVSLDAVESIILPIGRVEAREGVAGEQDGSWVDAGVIGESVDLLALPADGVTLLESELPEGEYNALRLYLTEEATITLSEQVRIGRTTFEARSYPLVIPSVDQNGVRLRSHFSVDDDGARLTVLFDGDATVRKVTATGSGALKIAPELSVRNEEGELVGEIDEDDGLDHEVEVEGQVGSVGGDGFTLEDGTEIRITSDTELAGEILSIAGLGAALAAGETVEVEVKGSYAADGSTVVAKQVEVDVED